MAEVAGLALSGVALVGLFSSCIEFLDYLEHGRNCARDVQVTLTKLGLLKQRLYAWGEAISIRSLKDEVPGRQCAEEQSLIAESLVGIHDLLKATSALYRKYGCGRLRLRDQSFRCQPAPIHAGGSNDATTPRKTASTLNLPWLKTADWRLEDKVGAHCGEATSDGILRPRDDDDTLSGFEPNFGLRPDPIKETAPPTNMALGSLRLKVIWALFDRKKFNSLLADLDFLLNNLERLAQHACMAPTEQHCKPVHEVEKEGMNDATNSAIAVRNDSDKDIAKYHLSNSSQKRTGLDSVSSTPASRSRNLPMSGNMGPDGVWRASTEDTPRLHTQSFKDLKSSNGALMATNAIEGSCVNSVENVAADTGSVMLTGKADGGTLELAKLWAPNAKKETPETREGQDAELKKN